MADELTSQEMAWLSELMPLVSAFKQNWRQWPTEQRRHALDEMCTIADRLHASLKDRGLEPRHSQSMIDNRSKDNEDPFYFNLHALEDLISIVSRLKK